jgi:hypothetical protein
MLGGAFALSAVALAGCTTDGAPSGGRRSGADSIYNGRGGHPGGDNGPERGR